MQTVTLGASQLEVTPIAYGTWQSGEGLICHVGVSNYTPEQITEFAAVLPVETVQLPYHLFCRGIEAGLLPYAQAHHIGVLAYGPLAHGLLGGAITFGGVAALYPGLP